MQDSGYQTQVLVIGGGSAGIAAAVAARNSGAEVILAETQAFLGGLATAARVGTICGLFLRSEDAPHWVYGGFPREFAERVTAQRRQAPERYAEGLWYLPYDYSQFARTAADVLETAGVRVLLQSSARAVRKQGTRISECLLQTLEGERWVVAESIIDCTGEALVSRLASDPLLPTQQLQAGALVFEIELPRQDLTLVLGRLLLREVLRGTAAGALPGECERVSLVPGSIREGKATFKIAVPELCSLDHAPLGDLWSKYRSLVQQLVSYLSASDSELRGCALGAVAPQLGVRSSQRALGRRVLTEAMVLAATDAEDGLVHAAWPIEEWGTARQVRMRYLPMHSYYRIPAGCLQSAVSENLYLAGRTISAEEGALASARVIGTCLATGYAAGVLASLRVQGQDVARAEHIIRGALAC